MTIDVNWKEIVSIFLSIANSQPVFFLLFGCHFLLLCLRGEIRFVMGSLVHFGWNFRTKIFFCCVLKISGAKWWTMMVDDRSFCVALASAWCLSGVICIIFRLVCTAGRVTKFISFVNSEAEAGPSICFSICCTEPMSRLIHGSTQEGLGCWLGLFILLYGTTISSGSLPSNPSDGALYTTYTLSIPLATCPPRRGSSSLLIRRSCAIQINSLSSIFNDGQHC